MLPREHVSSMPSTQFSRLQSLTGLLSNFCSAKMFYSKMLESHFSMTAVLLTESLLEIWLHCQHCFGNIRDNLQFGATNLLRNLMPKIKIITPLHEVLFHIFLNISIVTLHCYLCDMSGLLEVDLKIFIIYMY